LATASPCRSIGLRQTEVLIATAKARKIRKQYCQTTVEGKPNVKEVKSVLTDFHRAAIHGLRSKISTADKDAWRFSMPALVWDSARKAQNKNFN